MNVMTPILSHFYPSCFNAAPSQKFPRTPSFSTLSMSTHRPGMHPAVHVMLKLRLQTRAKGSLAK